MKSQTASEYLVVVSVVLLIALAIATTVGSFDWFGSPAKNFVSSFESIGLLSVTVYENYSAFDLVNNEQFALKLTSFSSKGGVCSYVSGGLSFSAGQSKRVSFVCPNHTSYYGSVGKTFTEEYVLSYVSVDTGASYNVSLVYDVRGWVYYPPAVLGLSPIGISSFSIVNATIFASFYNPTNRSFTLVNASSTWGKCFILNSSWPIAISSLQTIVLGLDCVNVSSQTLTHNYNITILNYSFDLRFITSDSLNVSNITQNNSMLSGTITDPLSVIHFRNTDWTAVGISRDGSTFGVGTSIAGYPWFISKNYGRSFFSSGFLHSGKYDIAFSANGSIILTGGSTGTNLTLSYDWGNSWVNKSQSRQWNSFAMSDSGQIMVATAQNSQLYLSYDFGATWVTRDVVRNWSGASMSANGSIILVGTDGGQLYVSNDSGLTWSNRSVSTTWRRVAVSANGSIQFAGVKIDNNTESVYVSTDYGLTWTARALNGDWFDVAISSSGQYGVAIDNDKKTRITSDYGTTWTQVGGLIGSFGVACSGNGSVCILGSSPSTTYISRDYGATWNIYNDYELWQGIATNVDGGYITSVAYSSPIQVSSDGGNTFVDRSLNTYYNDVSMVPNGSVQVSTTRQDGSFISTNYGQTWSLLPNVSYSDLNEYVGIGISHDGEYITQVAGSSISEKGYIYVMNRTSLFWEQRGENLSWVDVAVSGTGQYQIAIGNQSIFVSHNYGVNWTKNATIINPRRVSISADGKYVLASGGSSSTIILSTDYGHTWSTKLSVDRWNCIDQSYSGQIMIAFTEQYSFVSTDYGSSWIRHPSLMKKWDNCAISGDGTRIYASENDGSLYVSSDLGNTWRVITR
jgi:hypothetical protein